MNLVFFGSDYDFAVFGVSGAVFDRNYDRFLHLVADNDANSFFNCHYVSRLLWLNVGTGLTLGGLTLVFHGQ